jgi:hypothetical protein
LQNSDDLAARGLITLPKSATKKLKLFDSAASDIYCPSRHPLASSDF